MSPLLSTFAGASIRPFGFAGSGSAGPSLELISSTFLGTATPSVTFSLTGLQQTTYKHLQLRVTSNTANSALTGLYMQFNGDTTSNYTNHRVTAVGTTASIANTVVTPTTFNYVGQAQDSGSFGSTTFMPTMIDILDAFNTNKTKTFRSLSGTYIPFGFFTGMLGGSWMSTAAISSITFTNQAAVNFTVGSRFSLYGVRG